VNSAYLEKIGVFNPQQRIYFYQLLAHFLTVAMRGILFFEGIPDEERVERAKWLNEIAHRITLKVFLQVRNPERKWTDEEIWEMITKNIEKHPATEADVNLAIEMSYKYVIDNESEDIELTDTDNLL
jgi:hypothetical protein